MNATRRTGKQANIGFQILFLSFARWTLLIRFMRYLIYVTPRYALRLLWLYASSLVVLPLNLCEFICYGRRIRQVDIAKPPVFIIGHWRSGTTHLHNLMSQDAAFGYVSTYQAVVPDSSLVGRPWLQRLLAPVLPAKRPMDNMIWQIDLPQEEEIPLAKISPYAFYGLFLVPRHAQQWFKKFVLLHDASPRGIAAFKRKYYRLLQIATLHAGGKPLVLKNPVNTVRIRVLLALFPTAKFIHIYRSPYDVFASTRHLYRTFLATSTLQTFSDDEIDETVLSLYEIMMQRFFADRRLIPVGNRVEVRFEDLERDPLKELQRIYAMLDLPGFAVAEPAFRAYIESQRSYRKNRFVLTAQERQRIEQRWAFAFDALGYDRR